MKEKSSAMSGPTRALGSVIRDAERQHPRGPTASAKEDEVELGPMKVWNPSAATRSAFWRPWTRLAISTSMPWETLGVRFPLRCTERASQDLRSYFAGTMVNPKSAKCRSKVKQLSIASPRIRAKHVPSVKLRSSGP